MAINRVEITDFLVFKGEFAMDFCPGVNVIIGGNGTGKTTLLKTMYDYFKNERHFIQIYDNPIPITTGVQNAMKLISDFANIPRLLYIPEKDILEHAKGLLTFIEQKQTGFSTIYKDVLIAAQDIPTQKQSETQKYIGQKISAIIGGDVRWDKGEGSFYTLKTDGSRIPFANEASGYKKFGFLGLLVSSGQLEPGSVLFWDEPENSLNPELVPILVDILLELSRNGIQIFIATHSEILASYFAVNRQTGDNVMFTSLYKEGEWIKAGINNRFDLLEPNNLTSEPVKLYEKEIEKGLGDNG
jgi:predicted ATP-dependent endonuclease of OLD family